MVQPTAEQIQARNAFLSGPKPRTTIVEHNGHKLEVRQPSLGARNRVYKAAQISADTESEGDNGHSNGHGRPKNKVQVTFDLGKMQIVAVIACTYFPDTDVKVFSEIDFETLTSQLAGGGIDKLVSAAMDLLNVKQVDAEKKSESTQSASSSTTSA